MGRSKARRERDRKLEAAAKVVVAKALTQKKKENANEQSS